MNNIKIKIIGLGYGNINQADVLIYNMKGNLISDKRTYNNEVCFCLDTCNIYKVVIKNKNINISKIFYALDNSIIYINLYEFYPRTITFLLTDYYYENLPIMKGEIILWQK